MRREEKAKTWVSKFTSCVGVGQQNECLTRDRYMRQPCRYTQESSDIVGFKKTYVWEINITRVLRYWPLKDYTICEHTHRNARSQHRFIAKGANERQNSIRCPARNKQETNGDAGFRNANFHRCLRSVLIRAQTFHIHFFGLSFQGFLMIYDMRHDLRVVVNYHGHGDTVWECEDSANLGEDWKSEQEHMCGAIISWKSRHKFNVISRGDFTLVPQRQKPK